jgi:glycosyltransferase involved in cell wall biosynthesis
MQVSVVVCTYAEKRYDDFRAAAESVLGQTHDDVELVVVVDGNDTICERVRGAFGDDDRVKVHCNDRTRGLSYSRTRGVEAATGEVIAFLDDDAVAREDWVEQLCRGYEEEALAVGGRMVPEWVDGEPDHLPEEFSWLVGVTYEPRLEDWTEVRNTMGSNISFRREVFEELGGFDEQVGLAGDDNLQAEETEFCIRMRQTFGHGVLYNPEAVVAHKVFAYRTEVSWLLRRAFWQGYSKRAVESLGSDRGDAERDYLRHLALTAGPGRLRGLLREPSVAAVQQLCLLVALTLSVGLGYLYAFRRW